MGSNKVSVEQIEQRLTASINLLRNGETSNSRALTLNHLGSGTFARLCDKAQLIEPIKRIGRIAIYKYPDPNTDDGRTTIKVMAQWLIENPQRSVHRKRAGLPRRRYSPRKTSAASMENAVVTTPHIPLTDTEHLIKLLSQGLIILQAPLGKNLPANFVKEMQQKDVLIAELRKEVASLKKDMEDWNKLTEKVIARRAKQGE